MVKNLREYIKEAEQNKTAIGHFNISNLEILWSVFNAARSLELPVIIGVSEGERDFIGLRQAVALVKSLREEYNYPIFINADHSYSFERVRAAIDAGCDMVIFDGAELPIDKNIEETKKCVEYARKTNPDILVEGELGFIGKSSKLIEELPKGVSLETQTNPTDAIRFVKETEIDLFAPSVGNVHGLIKSGNPNLIIERIKAIKDAVKIPLVLHGGSGISDKDFQEAIASGIEMVHISTELRLAYQNSLKLSLQENPDETTPYKIMKPVVLAVEKVVDHKLRVFNKI